jgi:hypothetical protein
MSCSNPVKDIEDLVDELDGKRKLNGVDAVKRRKKDEQVEIEKGMGIEKKF